MATLAATYKRMETPVEIEAPAGQAWNQAADDPYRLRPLPCEDVYFFIKKVDNSRLVRQADPRERKRARSAIVGSFVVAVFMIAMLIPKALGMAAGYRLSALEQQYDQLVVERQRLSLEEARLVSTERLEELARTLQFVDPAPRQVHILNPKSDQAFALNVAAK